MTEEITQPENAGINITVEQILAAIVNTIGTITVPLDNLIVDYSGKSVAVNQNEDKSVTFSLIESPAQAEDQNTETAE